MDGIKQRCCLEEQRNEVVVGGLGKCEQKKRVCLCVCSRNEITRPCPAAAEKNPGEGEANHVRHS